MPASVHCMDPHSLPAACPYACYGHECIEGYSQFKTSYVQGTTWNLNCTAIDGLIFVTLGRVCFRVANFRHYLTLLQRSKM